MCVADLGRQPNTQTPDLLVDGERLGLRLMRLDGAESSPALDYEQLCEERRAARSRGGGPDPLRGDDPRPRAAAAERRGRLRALAASRQAPTPISWLGPGARRRICRRSPRRPGAGPLIELSAGASGEPALPAELPGRRGAVDAARSARPEPRRRGRSARRRPSSRSPSGAPAVPTAGADPRSPRAPRNTNVDRSATRR